MKRDTYGNVNILLLWYGGGEHDGGYLTDSMMVASRNPELETVTMFSIPRDLYVKSPVTGGYGRINVVFTQFFGRTKDIHTSALNTAEHISQILDMEIPYYATIDFAAFQEVVDTIWGIDIVVPETLHDTAYPEDATRGYITFHVDAGLQHMDGDIALKYARSRHSTSDFSRSLRQQQIMMAIKDKILSSGVSLSNAQDLYVQYQTYVNTNVSFSEMLWTVQYINSLHSFTSFGFTTYCSFINYINMSPACFLYNPDRENFWGAAVMLPIGADHTNPQKYTLLQEFVAFILSYQGFVKQKASIEVINGVDKQLARQKGMAAVPFAGNLAIKMKRYGFQIAETKNAETPITTSYIAINNIGDFSPTIQAIQKIVPITEIRDNSQLVVTGLDLSGNEISFFEGTDISIYLWEDYLLGSDQLSGLVEKKFSYEL